MSVKKQCKERKEREARILVITLFSVLYFDFCFICVDLRYVCLPRAPLRSTVGYTDFTASRLYLTPLRLDRLIFASIRGSFLYFFAAIKDSLDHRPGKQGSAPRMHRETGPRPK
jgi:hypothetical protein